MAGPSNDHPTSTPIIMDTWMTSSFAVTAEGTNVFISMKEISSLLNA